eukprot:32926-Pyramimonas_sp.AAC.1
MALSPQPRAFVIQQPQPLQGCRTVPFLPAILWCWVLVLTRQRPASPPLVSSFLLPLPPPVPPSLWHTPNTFRGPIGSSTEGPSATARM